MNDYRLDDGWVITSFSLSLTVSLELWEEDKLIKQFSITHHQLASLQTAIKESKLLV